MVPTWGGLWLAVAIYLSAGTQGPRWRRARHPQSPPSSCSRAGRHRRLVLADARPQRVPGENFLYLQAISTSALITTVVHMTGGRESDFAGLYVLLIAATALLMRPTSTALVTILAGLVYFPSVLRPPHRACLRHLDPARHLSCPSPR